jgi:hypothetical protein
MLNQRTKKTKLDPNHLVNPSKATIPNNNKLDCSPTTGKRLKDAVARKIIKNVKDRFLLGDKTPQDKPVIAAKTERLSQIRHSKASG